MAPKSSLSSLEACPASEAILQPCCMPLSFLLCGPLARHCKAGCCCLTKRIQIHVTSSLLPQDLDPSTRWTPRQALQHPFITQQRFTGPFQPAPARQERGQPMRGQPGRPGASPYDSSMSSMYHSPMAAMLATSPEFHAQAHAAAMAALQVRLVYCPGSL